MCHWCLDLSSFSDVNIFSFKFHWWVCYGLLRLSFNVNPCMDFSIPHRFFCCLPLCKAPRGWMEGSEPGPPCSIGGGVVQLYQGSYPYWNWVSRGEDSGLDIRTWTSSLDGSIWRKWASMGEWLDFCIILFPSWLCVSLGLCPGWDQLSRSPSVSTWMPRGTSCTTQGKARPR